MPSKIIWNSNTRKYFYIAKNDPLCLDCKTRIEIERSSFNLREELESLRKPEKQANISVVSVFLSKTKQRLEVIGFSLDTMTKGVHGAIPEWKVFQLIVKIDGKYRGELKRTWKPVGGIEIFCYLMFQKHTNIQFI